MSLLFNHAKRFTQLRKASASSSCSTTFPIAINHELDIIFYWLACCPGVCGCARSRSNSCSPGSSRVRRVSHAEARSTRIQRH